MQPQDQCAELWKFVFNQEMARLTAEDQPKTANPSGPLTAAQHATNAKAAANLASTAANAFAPHARQ